LLEGKRDDAKINISEQICYPDAIFKLLGQHILLPGYDLPTPYNVDKVDRIDEAF